MKNEEVKYLLKLFTIIDNSEIEEKNSKEFKKIYKKLNIIDEKIKTSEIYNEEMRNLQEILNNLEKEDFEKENNLEKEEVM